MDRASTARPPARLTALRAQQKGTQSNTSKRRIRKASYTPTSSVNKSQIIHTAADAAKSARIAHQNLHLDPSRVMRETTEERRTKKLIMKTAKTTPTLPPTAVGSHQSTSASGNSTTQAAP